MAREKRETEWREVRRKTSPKKDVPARTSCRDDPNTTTFYVTNLPGDARKGDLWRSCAKLGNLGCFWFLFGFIRFQSVPDTALMEEILNELICRGRKLVANCAKHPRHLAPQPKKLHVPVVRNVHRTHTATRDTRTFADVIGGKSSASVVPPTVKVTAVPEVVDWTANGVLVGVAKSFDILCNFSSLLSLEGFDVCEVKYLGGMDVVVKFKSGRAAEIFKANKSIWLKWFSSLEQFGKVIRKFERVAWVKVVGIPVQAWDNSNFAAVVGNWGKNTEDVSTGKLCILTACRKKINEELGIELDGVRHSVGILEVDDDWLPFKPFMVSEFSESEDSDDEDDEGIPDTFNQQDMKLEDGEIRQEEVDSPPATGDDAPAFETNGGRQIDVHGGKIEMPPRVPIARRINAMPVGNPNEIGFNAEPTRVITSDQVSGSSTYFGPAGLNHSTRPSFKSPGSSPIGNKCLT
ncbi:hypothetical protein LXL04_001353 [Taraxacum kok-saghyz]